MSLSNTELVELFAQMPAHDSTARAVAEERQLSLTKPAGSLGRLEQLAIWYAGVTGQGHPLREITHPRVAVFAGAHGVTAEGVSAFPAEVNAQMVANFQAGGAAINQLTAAIDGDLRVFDLNINIPTGNIRHEDAISVAEARTLIAYGMTAVDDPVDALILGDMGIGNTTSSAALSAALIAGESLFDSEGINLAQVASWVGRGTGIEDTQLAHKTAVIGDALTRIRPLLCDTLPNMTALDRCIAVLAALGGKEHLAMIGAMLAAGMKQIPVLLDGYVVGSAATAYEALRRAALPGNLPVGGHHLPVHLLAVHLSAEIGHRRQLEWLGLEPLLQWGMRLGEGAGATLGIPLLQAAIRCQNGMATFEEAAVAAKETP